MLAIPSGFCDNKDCCTIGELFFRVGDKDKVWQLSDWM